jgi:hypothetical protein
MLLHYITLTPIGIGLNNRGVLRLLPKSPYTACKRLEEGAYRSFYGMSILVYWLTNSIRDPTAALRLVN